MSGLFQLLCVLVVLFEDIVDGMCAVASFHMRCYTGNHHSEIVIPAGVLVMAKCVIAALEISCPRRFSFGFYPNTKYFS